jgi:aminoglycoside phosphotransferase (APT) family kinase protein
MHAGELPIDAAVARDLIGAQFPQWRGLDVRRVASSGTDNAIFRVGDRLAARFPLQGADPAATRRAL